MAVSQQTPLQAYTASGASAVFAFSFQLLNAADMTVLVDGAVKALGVDFSTTTGLGGAVTLVTTPTVGQRVVLLRNSSVTRSTDYQNNGDLLAAVVNADFDRLWLVLQELVFGSKASPTTVRAPAGEVLNELPVAASRASRVLAFDSAGNPIAIPGVDSGSAAALAIDLASSAASSKGAGQVGYDGGDATPLDYAENTAGWMFNILKYNDVRLIERIPRSEWAAIAAGTSTYNASTKILEIIADKPGRAIILPAGKIRIDSSIQRITSSASTFVEGLKLLGPGSTLCEIDSRVANGFAVYIDTDAVTPSARFQRNNVIAGVTISGATGTPANASGLYLRHAYNVLIDDVIFDRFTRDGLMIDIQEGDPDGSNSVIFRRSRAYGCQRWGVNVQAAAGTNECSFFQMIDGSTVTACGTGYAFNPTAGSLPTSGGVKWKGNAATFRDGGISECYNVAMCVDGNGGGLPLLLSMRDFTLENNGHRTIGGAVSTGVQCYVSGIRGAGFNGIDIRNNDNYRAGYGFFFEATTNTVAGIDIQRVQIQATTGNNPYTLYEGRGSSGIGINVGLTDYRLFDGTGQTRFGAGMYPGFLRPKFEDGSKDTFSTDATLETTYTSASPTYNADVARYAVHSILLAAGASGTLTLGTLTTASLSSTALIGREMEIVIANTSGVTINLSATGFGTRSMPTTLATGSTTSARFRYRSAASGWSQVGAWG